MNKAPKSNLNGKRRKPRGRKPHSKTARGLVIASISLLSVLSVLMIGVGVYFWRLYSLMGHNQGVTGDFIDSLVPEEMNKDYKDISDYTVIEEGASSVAELPVRTNTKNVQNFLLIGIDTRKSNSFIGLSDAVIILTIDTGRKEIKLTSILRDTLVSLPGRDRNGDGKDDYSKFNASYSLGGFNLLSKTIEQNFRLKIDKYITMNFAAFQEVVNYMGGVDIKLTQAEAKWIKVGSAADTYHLNGKKALSYARIRKLDSDFGRTNRQRKTLTAMFNKAKTMSIGNLNGILNKMLPRVDTNMTANEFTVFIFNSMTYFGYKMDKTFYLPQSGEYRNAPEYGLGSVLLLKDPAQAVTDLHKFIYN